MQQKEKIILPEALQQFFNNKKLISKQELMEKTKITGSNQYLLGNFILIKIKENKIFVKDIKF